MRAIVCGANGAMGKLIQNRLQAEVAGLVSIDGENGVPKTFAELGNVGADVIIDFSHHSAIEAVMEYAKAQNCAVVVGTTGHTEEEKTVIHAAAQQIPVFFSGNMSLGIAVLCRLAKQAAAVFPDADVEIVESHHNQKLDAPSGTALMIRDALISANPKLSADRISICSVRVGKLFGEHEVIFANNRDEFVTYKHQVTSREPFADGAISVAKWILSQPCGLYGMGDFCDF